MAEEQQLDGGNIGGAVRVGNTVRRAAGPWTPAEDTLDQVARWLRGYHQAVTDFVPPPGAVWREGGTWSPGLIIGHNDAAPDNAAWSQGRLAGFFDWDFAGPVTQEWDLAFAGFSWVPLHARHVVAAEGFTDFAARPRRLRRFLRAYGWTGTEAGFLRLLAQGVADDLDQALAELRTFPG